MNDRYQKSPTSRCRLGVARHDITPPIGIYHRFWGAAVHDQSTGLHRRLSATVLLLAPLAESPGDDNADTRVLVALDHCLFRPQEMNELLAETCRSANLEPSQVTFAFSHTHSGGHIARSRAELPGGELIAPYLNALPRMVASAIESARESIQPVVLSYATAHCGMGRNRDDWDDASKQYVCGFNPQVEIDLPVNVVRATDGRGKCVATIVNYPCHPTTLAWDNTLISPDYVGALRETVEKIIDAPCVFLLAPCGDIGPMHGFVGDVRVADRNGRQVAFAALGAYESLQPPAHDFHYCGPVISGATIGTWEYRPHSQTRQHETTIFRRRQWEVTLPYLDTLPTVVEAERQLAYSMAQEEAARRAGDEPLARELRARAERSRRLLERVQPLPEGSCYPFSLDVLQIGDAFWIAVEGEPYHALQQSLMSRFPGVPLIFAALANGSRVSYLPTRDAYDKPLYQVEVANVAPGSLEAIIDAIGNQIEEWRHTPA